MQLLSSGGQPKIQSFFKQTAEFKMNSHYRKQNSAAHYFRPSERTPSLRLISVRACIRSYISWNLKGIMKHYPFVLLYLRFFFWFPSSFSETFLKAIHFFSSISLVSEIDANTTLMSNGKSNKIFIHALVLKCSNDSRLCFTIQIIISIQITF